MNNLKKLIAILSILTAVFCSNENSSDPIIQKVVSVSGKLIPTFTEVSISNISIVLSGKSEFATVSDSEGKFEFTSIPLDEYQLIINNSLFHPVDSLFILDRDTTLKINIENVVSDYFPLQVGNFWTFEFQNYRPHSSGHHQQDGHLTWEVLKITHTDSTIIYSIKESVIGVDSARILYPGELRATNINYAEETKFIKYKNGFLRICAPSYLYRELEFQIYYPESLFQVILDNRYLKVTPYLNTLDMETDMVNLETGVGIKRWDIQNTHNGGPSGRFFLVNYFVQK